MQKIQGIKGLKKLKRQLTKNDRYLDDLNKIKMQQIDQRLTATIGQQM
jgi:hypothetical protein